MVTRSYYIKIWQELSIEKSMVFAAGTRQSGKTTLAKMIANDYANHLYFNWDIPEKRIRLLENPFFFEALERHDASRPLIVFDEIHQRTGKTISRGFMIVFMKSFHFLSAAAGAWISIKKGAILWSVAISCFTFGRSLWRNGAEAESAWPISGKPLWMYQVIIALKTR
jgi:hypothetical protein